MSQVGVLLLGGRTQVRQVAAGRGEGQGQGEGEGTEDGGSPAPDPAPAAPPGGDSGRGRWQEERYPREEEAEEEPAAVVARSPLIRISDDELEQLLAPDNDLLCAITGELFEDPVVTDDGHTYERAAIEEWFHSQKLAGRPVTSPKTNVKLKNTRVVQNNKVKSDVIKWCEDLAKRAKDLADEYPGSAIDLLERALEYHPDNADTWLQLGCAHEDHATEGWRASAFRCRFNHSQAKDTEEDYKSFLEWCEQNDQLAEFEAAVLRI
eukprot:COSAG02_NODE_19626_length_872_cov_1.978008_1_plen_264_part_10